MAVIHIFKDGTVKTELKDVYVPKELVEQVVAIARTKPVENERRKKSGT